MVIIVTGATGSIGKAAVEMLREKGHTAIPTSRQKPLDGYRYLDVSSPTSIEAFVQGLEADHIRIDGLLNNAGTMQRRFLTTPDGHELVTATKNWSSPFIINSRKSKQSYTVFQISLNFILHKASNKVTLHVHHCFWRIFINWFYRITVVTCKDVC